jgi:ribosomal protein S18 acetylase RimI-like enzyme
MKIRTFQESDRETLKRITIISFDGVSIDRNIENLCGPIAGKSWEWRKGRQIDEDLNANPGGVFVAEDDGQCVGYITTRIDPASRIGGIPNLAVLPEYRKSGLGHKLMDTAMEYFRRQGMQYARIETLDQNPVGQRFYPGYGFKEVARQIHYIMPVGESGSV